MQEDGQSIGMVLAEIAIVLGWTEADDGLTGGENADATIARNSSQE